MLPQPDSKSRYAQGYFKPIHPEKYKGNPTNIVYRSSWELKFMGICDSNPAVLEWKSEEFYIPYISPKDNRLHRYFIDFQAKMNTNQGIKTYLIEVKPHSQTQPPKKKKKVTKSYLNEIVTYAVNKAKFDAAHEYCKKRGWEFSILNEYDLGIKKK